MFTIGIFSTHIPYIAFVLFYAYFFVAGISKAVSGEIPSGEDSKKIEIHTTDTFVDYGGDTYHFFNGVAEFDETCNTQDFLFETRIDYPKYVDPDFKPDYRFQSIFSRPPPVA